MKCVVTLMTPKQFKNLCFSIGLTDICGITPNFYDGFRACSPHDKNVCALYNPKFGYRVAEVDESKPFGNNYGVWNLSCEDVIIMNKLTKLSLELKNLGIKIKKLNIEKDFK